MLLGIMMYNLVGVLFFCLCIFEFEFITICIAQNVQMYLNALNRNKTW